MSGHHGIVGNAGEKYLLALRYFTSGACFLRILEAEERDCYKKVIKKDTVDKVHYYQKGRNHMLYSPLPHRAGVPARVNGWPGERRSPEPGRSAQVPGRVRRDQRAGILSLRAKRRSICAKGSPVSTACRSLASSRSGNAMAWLREWYRSYPLMQITRRPFPKVVRCEAHPTDEHAPRSCGFGTELPFKNMQIGRWRRALVPFCLHEKKILIYQRAHRCHRP